MSKKLKANMTEKKVQDIPIDEDDDVSIYAIFYSIDYISDIIHRHDKIREVKSIDRDLAVHVIVKYFSVTLVK